MNCCILSVYIWRKVLKTNSQVIHVHIICIFDYHTKFLIALRLLLKFLEIGTVTLPNVFAFKQLDLGIV